MHASAGRINPPSASTWSWVLSSNTTSGSWPGSAEAALSNFRNTSAYEAPWSLAVTRAAGGGVAPRGRHQPPRQQDAQTDALSLHRCLLPSVSRVAWERPGHVIRRITSPLDRAGRDAADDLAREGDEQQHDGQRHDQGGGDADVGVGDLDAGDRAQADLRRLKAVVVDDGLGPQILVPGAERRDHDEGGDDRPRQGHGEAPQELQVPVAIELGGVVDLGGYAPEALPNEERPEGGSGEGEHQSGVRVDPAQLADGLHVA